MIKVSPMYGIQEMRLYGLVKVSCSNNSSLENQPFMVRPSNCRFKFSGQPQLAQKINHELLMMVLSQPLYKLFQK